MSSTTLEAAPDAISRDENINDLEMQDITVRTVLDHLPAAYPGWSVVERPQNAIHEIGFVAVLSCSQLMNQAGLAVSIAPLPIISYSFGTDSPGQQSWMPAAYSLTVGTFILIAGRLGDFVRP